MRFCVSNLPRYSLKRPLNKGNIISHCSDGIAMRELNGIFDKRCFCSVSVVKFRPAVSEVMLWPVCLSIKRARVQFQRNQNVPSLPSSIRWLEKLTRINKWCYHEFSIIKKSCPLCECRLSVMPIIPDPIKNIFSRSHAMLEFELSG